MGPYGGAVPKITNCTLGGPVLHKLAKCSAAFTSGSSAERLGKAQNTDCTLGGPAVHRLVKCSAAVFRACRRCPRLAVHRLVKCSAAVFRACRWCPRLALQRASASLSLSSGLTDGARGWQCRGRVPGCLCLQGLQTVPAAGSAEGACQAVSVFKACRWCPRLAVKRACTRLSSRLADGARGWQCRGRVPGCLCLQGLQTVPAAGSAEGACQAVSVFRACRRCPRLAVQRARARLSLSSGLADGARGWQ
ncbi:hypothetical protein NDU88_002711 [Pleurodeles waltl]|uniref:Uncharacterized protein n=1 Tax=Pleurodeles waltl TaxID=8319 RepID=A0AAV7M6S9_PLEWA|nr:hypothetical protein NDU88_002711 [Pleurodeles waltl]